MTLLEFSPIEVIIALASFVGLTIAILMLNDRIEDRLPKIDLEESVKRVLAQPPNDKSKQLLSLFEASRLETKIDGETMLSNIMAYISAVLSLIPVLFILGEAKHLLVFNGLIYLICSILIITAISVNRIASGRLKRLTKMPA